jgi:hypothetical protein
MHFPHRIQRAAFRPIGVLFRLQISLEDRFQYQNRRHLDHAILDGRYAQRSLLSVGFWDVYPANRQRAIGLRPQRLRPFFQPFRHAALFNLLERDSVHARRTTVGAASPPRLRQHILAMEFVVQRVEPVGRIPLRFGMQRCLQLLEFVRR